MVQTSDLVLVTIRDEGFTVNEGSVNYYLSGEDCVDRFGRDHRCADCAVRPALLLEPGDEKMLSNTREVEGIVTVELPSFSSLRCAIWRRGSIRKGR